MELSVWLGEEAVLREGSKAFVKNLGFMGEKYVGLTSGKQNAPILGANATIIGQEEINPILMSLAHHFHYIWERCTNLNRTNRSNPRVVRNNHHLPRRNPFRRKLHLGTK